MMKLKAIMFKEYPEVFYRFHPIHFIRATIEVTKKGIFHSTEQTQTLYSAAKEACPEFKQTGKFLAQLKNHLKEMVDEKETVLIMDKQKVLTGSPKPSVSATAIESKEPSTFLNGTSIIKGLSNDRNEVKVLG